LLSPENKCKNYHPYYFFLTLYPIFFHSNVYSMVNMLLFVAAAAAWFLPLVVAQEDAITDNDDDCSPSIDPRPSLGLLWGSVPIIFFVSLLGAGLPVAIATKPNSIVRLIITVSCAD
jgi:hypothetical protein